MVALLKCQSDARLASATFHGAKRLFMSQNAAGQPRALSFLFFSFSLTSIRSAQGVRKKESEEKRGTAEFAGRPGTRPRARRPFLGRSAPFVSAVAIEKEQQRGRVSRLLRPGRQASCPTLAPTAPRWHRRLVQTPGLLSPAISTPVCPWSRPACLCSEYECYKKPSSHGFMVTTYRSVSLYVESQRKCTSLKMVQLERRQHGT